MGTLINDCDSCFRDSIAQEVNKLAGTTATIFQFLEPKSTRNPYYGESTDRVYQARNAGGIDCPVFFSSPDRSPMSGEEGFRMDKSSTLFVARADLDSRNLKLLRMGDIVKIWGLYFDVTNSSSTSGRFSDSGHTSLYEVSVIRRTKSLPEGLRM